MQILFIGFCFLFSVKIYSTSIFSKENIQKLIELSDSLIYIPAGSVHTFDTGESIVLDSSGFVQYAYKTIFGIQLPRESIGQYRYLFSKNLILNTPKRETGEIDQEELNRNLKKGDLLFWINTHSDIPTDRNPPISHVMIYLGKSKLGNHIMVGVGSKGIGKNTDSGGVDLYLFSPEKFMGCVRDESGSCSLNSEFIGHGRPRR
jgi:hypothetical protein